MAYSPQVPNRRSGLRPVHWVLLGLGGALLLVCGLCGVLGVIGAATDPAPSTSVAAAGSPSAGSPSAGAPSEAGSPGTVAPPSEAAAAPLVGDAAPAPERTVETEVSAEADTGRRTAVAAPTTREADPPRTSAPRTSAPRTSAPTTTAPQTSAPKTSAPRTSAPAPVYYANCAAVRAAGAAPIRVGQPGYAKHLDRDEDGVGCE